MARVAGQLGPTCPRSRGHREERRRAAEGRKSQRALEGKGGWHFSERKALRQQQHVSTVGTHLVVLVMF